MKKGGTMNDAPRTCSHNGEILLYTFTSWCNNMVKQENKVEVEMLKRTDN
jgi:hypothetical protein